MEVAHEEVITDEHHRKGGLVEIFSNLKDPRKRARTYPLPAMMTGLVMALLRGVTCMNQVPVFLKTLHHKQRKKIGFHGKIPDESRFRYILTVMDLAELERLIAPWLADEGLEDFAIAIDGKRLCGARNKGEKLPQVLNIVGHNSGNILGSVCMSPEEDERAAARRFISENELAGALITGDALHTNRDLLFLILSKRADYLMYVKKNQRIVCDIIDNYKLDERPGPAHACTCEISKGREEIREIWITTQGCKSKSEEPLLPGANQVGTIVRTITDLKTGKVTRERVHFATTLKRTEASPESLLKIVRGQWTVEARNHYVKDTTMGEDRSRCRRGNLPYTLATLRNIALKILRKVQLCYCNKCGRSTIPEAMRFLELNGGVCTLLKT